MSLLFVFKYLLQWLEAALNGIKELFPKADDAEGEADAEAEG